MWLFQWRPILLTLRSFSPVCFSRRNTLSLSLPFLGHVVSPSPPTSPEFESPVHLASSLLRSLKGKSASPRMDPNLYLIVSLLDYLMIFLPCGLGQWDIQAMGRWIHWDITLPHVVNNFFYINNISKSAQMSIIWNCHTFLNIISYRWASF